MSSVQLISQNNDLKKKFKDIFKSKYEVFITGSIKDGMRNIKKMDIDLLLVDIQTNHLRSLTWVDSVFRQKNMDIGEMCFILLIDSESINKPDIQNLINLKKTFHIFWYNNSLMEQQENLLCALEFFMQNKMKDLETLRQNHIYYQQLNILANNKLLRNQMTANDKNILMENQPLAFLQMTSSNDFFQKQIANTPKWQTTLLRGPEGAEHNNIARHIHVLNGSQGPFIETDLSAIPKYFHEAMLFGSRQKNLPGFRYINNSLLEMAKKGTLYIKNFEHLRWEVQNELIRILQDQFFYREDQQVKVKCKIIFSTHADLEKYVEKSLIRQDLFSHLMMYTINIPTIYQRKKDLPLLIDTYVTWYENKYRKKIDISPEMKLEIMKKNFPGQFDQFYNFLYQIFSLAENKITLALISLFEAEPMPSETGQKKQSATKQPINPGLKNFIREKSDPTLFLFAMDKNEPTIEYSLTDIEREYIKYILNHNFNNIAESSRILGITRKTLYQKLKKYNLISPEKNTG